jgi:hypothetical protein
MRLCSLLLVVPWLLAIETLGACSNQSEGDVCDPQNGDSDCRDGLSCKSAPGLTNNQYRCCPSDSTQATTAACSAPSPSVDASPAPPEGGSTPDAPSSTPGEAGLDAAGAIDAPDADAASEAAADAGSDGMGEVGAVADASDGARE